MPSKSSILSFVILVTAITPLLSLNPPTVHLLTNRLEGKKSNGFTAELIHRDNPQSPFYNNSLSRSNRLIASFQDSRSRSSNRRRYHNDALQADVTQETDLYVMKFYIGTPAVEANAIVDTGSDIFWLQCKPCKNCFDQKMPIFDPAQSTTFKKISCQDPRCDLLADHNKCATNDDNCLYSISYIDESYSNGHLSLETLTFKDIPVRDVAFGCGFDNVDTSRATLKPSGLIGLSREPLSFVMQQKIHSFSYCLVENNKEDTSFIHFRWDDTLPLPGQSTPMLDDPTVYHLGLEGISVGSTRLPLPEGFFSRTSSGDGGFIIDSGATYGTLKTDALIKLIDEMRRQIKGLTLYQNLIRTEEDDEVLGLCYKGPLDQIKSVLPDLTFHFGGGLDLVLSKEGTWEEKDDGDGVHICLTIEEEDDTSHASVFGNLQQTNFNIGYDLTNERVWFERMESCKGI